MSEGEEIPYPHIKGAGVVVPDCSRGIYRPFRLTAGEKRKLIRELAEKGLKGLDDFMSSPPQDGAVHDSLEEVRKRISEEMDKVREKRRGSLDRSIRKLTSENETALMESADGLLSDDTSFRRFSSEQIKGEILATDIIRALEGTEKSQEYVKRPSLLSRIISLIKRFFLWVIRGVGKVFGALRSLFSRKGKIKDRKDKRTGSKGAVSLPFPGIERDLSRWEEKMESRLDRDDHLQKAVNSKLSDRYGYSSGYIELKRSYDPDWYKKEAREVLRDEVKHVSTEKEEELKKSRDKEEERARKRREDAMRVKESILEMERRFDRETEEREEKMEDLAREEVRTKLIDTLSSMGLIHRSEGAPGIGEEAEEWEITQALVEKFSEFIFSEVINTSRGPRDMRGHLISDAGVYERGRLRTIAEEPRMDMLQTIVNARVNHPKYKGIDTFDEVVYREVKTSEMHAVLLIDVSGSMEENERLEAAKRSVLALSQAVRRDNPRNRVDLVSVSTRSKPITLKEVMGMEPKGFTNMHEAFAIARSIFDGSRSDRHILFLITDGLPEAYTTTEGEAVAGDLEKAMERTLDEIRGFKRFSDLSFNIFLLEPEDETYVNSARKMAKEGHGNVILADPKELAGRVLESYLSGAAVLGGV